MELYSCSSTVPSQSQITNLSENTDNPPNTVLVKQEAPEAVVNQLELLEHEVNTIQSGELATEHECKSASKNILEPTVISNCSFQLKLERLPQGHDEDFSIKQELLHVELDIKSEDKTTQEPSLDDKYNAGENQLHTHITIPSGLKLFKCNVCDYSFKYKSFLQRHLRIHTGEKPFKCNACDFTFALKYDMQRHLKTHTGVKPFKCNICKYSSRLNSALRRHFRTHTGEKPFKCNICKYSSAETGTLQRHLRTHSGEKPFECNICEYSFRDNSDLQKHLRTHMTEKQFKCNICNYSCRTNRTLKKHLQTHTGQKPVNSNISF